MNVLLDLRYAARILRKNPGFTLTAVLSLALGIGANAAIFTLINALLLKSLPVRDPQSLFFIAKRASSGGVDAAFYYETYDRLRREQRYFGTIAAYDSVRMNIGAAGAPGESETAVGQLVSGNYYDVLGVAPVAGRLFTPADDRTPGAHPVAVISYAWWQRRYGLDPSAVGRKILIDGTPFTIIGVTPPGFNGMDVGAAPEVNVPIMMQPQVMPDKESWLGRAGNTVDWVKMFGRLAPGVSQDAATSGLQRLFFQIQTQLADEIGLGKASWRKEWVEARVVLAPGGTGISGLRRQFSFALFVLLGMVGMVLLIACANVANLMLARAAARKREIALRLAIGASRGRVIRQMLVESALLSAIGGVLGIAVAYWASGLLVEFLSTGRDRLIHLDLAPDWRVLAFTAAVSITTGVLFGLAPAIRGASLDPARALQQGGRGASAPQRLARVLSAVQVGLSLVLLVGAGLLVRTLRKAGDLDAGFPRDQVYSVGVSPRGSDQKNVNGPQLNRIYLDLLRRVREIPGVAAASLSGDSPVSRGYTRPYTTLDGRQFVAAQNMIYSSYFTTLGSSIVQGRDFGPADMAEGAALVAIVNESLARRVFPGESPLGKRIVCSGRISMGENGKPCEVIGVARDIPYPALKSEPPNMIYMTFLQCPTGRGAMELQVRAAGGGAALVGQLRREVAAIDPYLPAFQVRTLATQVETVLLRERLLALLSTIFGGLAALLAGIGLYGVVAYSVGRRTQEIGVRMALGARPGAVLRLVLGETLTLAAAGIVLGIPAALASARLLTGFLYGVDPADPTVLVGSVAFLAATGALAGFLPARRAARIDPVAALREE